MEKSIETFCNVKLNPTTWKSIPNKLRCTIEVKLTSEHSSNSNG